jgi:hypothetical protein
VAAIIVATVAVAATPPTWHRYRAHGISVRYPPSWFATARSLTPVTYPRQVLAVASYRSLWWQPAPGEHRERDVRVEVLVLAAPDHVEDLREPALLSG